jgi:hypothetical protein
MGGGVFGAAAVQQQVTGAAADLPWRCTWAPDETGPQVEHHVMHGAPAR